MTRVAGVDSSTQACKVVVRDAESGTLIRSGRAAHPNGTEVAPQCWWEALQAAVEDAGGLEDVSALSVAGQQHGMVTLDDEGHPVRDALLWNDTRSAADARDLVLEMGHGDEQAGGRWWAERMGSVPVASLTVSKLRWLARNEPGNAERVAAVALPHDWLTWKLAGTDRLAALTTDRSDASGTGYWSPLTGEYDFDILERALRHRAVVPQVLGPADAAGHGAVGAVTELGRHVLLGPGAGAVLDAYRHAWRVRRKTGDTSDEVLVAALRQSDAPPKFTDPESPEYEVLVGFWRRGVSPRWLPVAGFAQVVRESLAPWAEVFRDTAESLAWMELPAGNGR